MDKVEILEFFALLNLVIGSLVAAFFVYSGLRAPFMDTNAIIIGIGVFLGSLLQFALLGGLAEMIKRLISIDRTLKNQLNLPPQKIPDRPISPEPNDVSM